MSDEPPSAPDREAQVAGAVDVRRIDRGDPELGAGRLRLLPVPPADRDAVLGEAERAAEPADEEQLLERRVRGHEEPQRRRIRPPPRRFAASVASAVVPVRRARARRRPSGRSGPLQAIVAFDPPIVEAADVAHPVVVDLGVEPRGRANQLRALRPLRLGLDPRRRVAALLAERADRVDGVAGCPTAAT